MQSMNPRSWSSTNARAAVPPSNVAPLGRPANREPQSAVIHTIVAPCDFEKHRTGLATQ